MEISLDAPGATSAGTSGQPNDDVGDVVKMPQFFVAAHWHLPPEKDMLTDYGRLQLAKKESISPLYRVTFGPLSQVATYYFNFLTILNGWHPNDAEAMTLYRESERVQILRDFDELRRLEQFGDPKTAGKLRQMRQEMWRTGIDALYWDPSPSASGIYIGRRKR